MNIFKSKEKRKEDLKSKIISEIKELGSVGVDEALKGNIVLAKIVIDRLDQVRMFNAGNGITFAEEEASRQIDRVRSKID
jgi:hypothetical protein